MPTKNFSGSLINYGTALPDPNTTPDGALFFKVGGVDEGLYLFSFTGDTTTTTIGDNLGQSWVPLVNTSGVDADTLDGLDSTAFQLSNPLLSAISGTASNGILVRTSSATAAARSVVSAVGNRISVTNGNGVAGDITLDVSESNLVLSNMSGTLPVSKGGTNFTSVTAGGVAYGTTDPAIKTTAAGAAGQLLMSTGASAPTWADPASLSVGTANYANSAGTASSAVQVSNSVTFSSAGAGDISGTAFNGAASRTVSYNTIGAPSVSGANATGTWAISISGTAATATTAAALSTARTIALSGDVTGSAVFDGSANITITTTVADDSHAHTVYVQKSGDTMTGALGTTALAVGAITMPSTGSAAFAANAIAAGYVQAGLTTGSVNGTIRLQSSSNGNSGTLEFWSGNDVRGGYIGSTDAAASTDAGTVNYVAGSHAFTGNLTVTGNISANGNVTAFATSDGRLKKDIVTIENALDKLKALRGVDYTMKDSGRRETGLIAQEVLQVVPEVVRESSDGIYGIAYGNLVGLLVEAIKEQQAQIDELKSKLSN